MKPNSSRTAAMAIAGFVLFLAIAMTGLALERGGDVLMIGLALVLAATSMQLFRRVYPPV